MCSLSSPVKVLFVAIINVKLSSSKSRCVIFQVEKFYCTTERERTPKQQQQKQNRWHQVKIYSSEGEVRARELESTFARFVSFTHQTFFSLPRSACCCFVSTSSRDPPVRLYGSRSLPGRRRNWKLYPILRAVWAKTAARHAKESERKGRQAPVKRFGREFSLARLNDRVTLGLDSQSSFVRVSANETFNYSCPTQQQHICRITDMMSCENYNSNRTRAIEEKKNK